MAATAPTTTTTASRISIDHGCSTTMFDCLGHLWDWFDPQENQSHFTMDNSNKATPATQQPHTQHHLMAHHVHPNDQIYNHQSPQIATLITTPQPGQIPPNGVMHQLLQSQYKSNMDARSPLLENRHEVYVTGQNVGYARHYGANENYNYPQSPQRQEAEYLTDHNVNHELLQNMPIGYNAEVYHDYLKRNPPKETNQVYQNNQSAPNRPNTSANTNGSTPTTAYMPYQNRAGAQSNTEILRRQYNELQQMKLQQQMHYQSQAQIFQQQKFAERQLLLQQLHGVQPPPNLQNSIYSDGSFRDFDKYGSRNDFKEYNPADIHKDIDKYVKNNEFREIDKHNQYPQEPKWQTNHQIDYREVERYRKSEPGKTKSQPTVSEFSPQEPKNNVGAGASSPMKSSESSSPSIKSPSTDSRKSSSGGTIRSPIAQRTPSAPVTMAGVLYKQGSDGLKVWRKRWFVLSEYCLFYYKNQEEEKLLGSVLLPSYKVSACTADDRVLRKFAFKLEHANMRTYILAAPDFESMMKWVKTLTMAALMQTPYEPSKERSTVRPEDFEDAGPTYANAPPKPRRSNEGYSSPSPEMYDPNYDLLKKPPSHFNQGTVGEQQPEQTYQTSPNPNAIYARNPQSPPQPGQYQSKRSHDIHNLSLPLTSTTTADSQRANQTIYKSNTHTYYDNRERIQQQLQRAQEEQLYERRSQVTYNPFLQETSIIEPDRPSQVNEMSSDSRVDPNMQYKDVKLETSPRTIRPLPADRVLDRRTPETYGRSTSMSSYNKTKAGDYEDVYGYSSEVGYPNSNNERSSQSQSRDINNAMTINDPPRMAPPEKTFSGPSVLRRKKMQLSGIQPPVPRPHSADFLEYESKNEMMQNKIMPYKDTYDTPKQPQRPKSSLDINSFYDPSSDRYYSEESYAAKMRQSAQYLQAGLGPSNIQIPLAKYASGLAEKQLHSPFTPSVNNNYEIEFASRKPRNSTENLKFKEQEAIHSNWMLKEKENRKDFINRQNIKEDNALLYTKEARQEPLPDGFMRSASARLPTTSGEKEGETKVQQREESMKRLLEWKQRMLQSPLTRKSTPATISLARSLNQSRQSLRSDQYKTKNYGNPPYNNYSSDDEEESTDTEQQITKKVQAGRSQIENISSPTQTHQKTSHSSPPCLDETQISPKCNNIPLTNDNTYENMSIVNATRQRSLSFGESTYVNTTVGTEDTVVKNFDETSSQDGYETHDSEAESETQLEYTDNDLDEVLNSDEEPVQLDRTDSTLENKTNVSLNTDMVEDNIPSTPPACSAEDHYLPMSPRKVSNVEPAHKTIIENISVFDNSMRHPLEDNPYVEMNLGSEEDEMQNYEVVCVSNDKMEPVYMELGTVSSTDDSSEISSTITRKQVTDTATNFADSNVHTLKRASKGSKKNSPNIMINKSDGSDADDEASKDITLSMPFSRLSISDTFRPASYYLGRSRQSLLSQTYNETGSISPASSTPSLGIDINGEALSQYVLEKLDQSTISQESSILKMLTNENQNMNSAKRKTTSLMIYGSKTSIHDTLSRGEKIRNSRINLTEKNKLLDAKQNLLLNSMMARYDSNRSIEFDTDSLMSFNAERGCSRLSLNSDVSSKFEMTPSHYSSEVVSLNESESALEYRNLENYRDMETVIKRRPLSEDSFELGAACALESNDVASGIDFDNYLDKLQPDEMRNTVTGRLSLDTSNINTSLKDNLARAANIVSHARCSSTPSNISISNSSILVPKTAIARNFSDQNSGYTGSQSSCSSLGASKSPILYYTKSYDEEKDLSKNLNITDRKNKIVRDKTDLKHANDINISKTHFHSRESSTEQSAPYYYSDLSSQEQINVTPTSHYLKNTNLHRKLNNQRRKISMGKKSEISHIHNPIHSNSLSGESYELASVNRSISVEFLTATDKDLDIDLKNVYASSKGLNSKISDSMKVISNFELNSHDNLGQLNSESCSKNDNPHNTSAKASSTNVSSPCSEHSSNTVYYDAEAEVCAYENMLYHGDNLWEEDKLWRDNLRRVSHRHARSMDDLDTLPSEPFNNEIANTAINSIKRVKKDKKITRNVTYVNCDFQNEIYKKSNDEVHLNQSDYKDKSSDENDVYVSLVKESEVEQSDEGVYEQLVVESSNNSLVTPDTQQKNKMESKAKRRFEIDREKLRQWDLMSSGLMKGAKGVVRGLGAGGLGDALCSTDSGAESASLGAAIMRSGVHANNNYSSNSQSISKKPFLGSNTSIGRNNRENTIPVRAVSPRVRWVEEKQAGEHYGSQLHLSISQQNLYSMGNEDAWANMRSPSRASQQPIRAVSPRIRRNTDNEDIPRNARGLSKSESGVVPTAGELLGRTHEELVLLLIQLRRRHAATHRAIEQCCLQISSIEECLSSLKAMEREESLQRLDQLKMQLMELEHQYEKSKPLVQLVDNMVKLGSLYNRPGSTIERLERNQRLREKVLTEHAMEQQRWLESAAAGKSLETEASRVRVAELWALEQELADEAHLIQGLKTDKDAIESLLTGVRSKFDGMQVSECKTGEDLEAELTRVHAMLALNSKKLEQTVADNARLERELTQLRRALQAQRQSNAPTTPAVATAMLEDEVSRVQQLVSALQRQRQELSRAVRHLTQQSHALQTTHNSLPRSKQQQQQRRPHSSWQETNLDTGYTKDHGQADYDYDVSSPVGPGYYSKNVETPLYVDTRGNGQDVMSPSNSEDLQNSAFNNLSNVEKQEIKTVRIVKRESERRQRDRDRSFQPMGDWPSNNLTNLDQYIDEDLQQNQTYQQPSSVAKTDFSKFEEYYSKAPDTSLYSKNGKDSSLSKELSPRYPSSPSLSTYDYSRDMSSISSSYNKNYDRSTYERTMSASTQYLNSPTDSSRTLTNDPMSKTSSIGSLTRSHMELSPIFKSEAAKQIITEVSGDTIKNGSLHRRQVPKEKRRHYTAPHHLSAKTLSEMPKDMFNPEHGMGRSLDDADMELALRAPPDVVRSALPAQPLRYAQNTIDQLLAAPQKILIPERYIPEKPPELSPEEQLKRQEKVESIKKMLSSSSAADPNKSPDTEEKKQRDHLLQMNQILAKQVTEMSKIIAVKALEELPRSNNNGNFDDYSPEVELPIYQQRENFFT